MSTGKFIVVEGLEGAGKTTAMRIMQKILKDKSIPYILTREPGGTELGEAIRILLKSTHYKHKVDDRAELLLFYAARVQLIEEVIRPSLNQGVWVLADRFEWSTFAYQGGGRQLDSNLLNTLSKNCVNIKPDWVFFLDIPPALGLKRARGRGLLDRIEQEPLTFFQAVQAAYYAQMQTMQQVIPIDATQPLPLMKRTIREKFTHIIQFNGE